MQRAFACFQISSQLVPRQELMPFKEVVVATGGGAVTRRVNWGYMQHGVVTWLSGPPALLARRAVSDGPGSRPMLGVRPCLTHLHKPALVGSVKLRECEPCIRMHASCGLAFGLQRSTSCTAQLLQPYPSHRIALWTVPVSLKGIQGIGIYVSLIPSTLCRWSCMTLCPVHSPAPCLIPQS